jgi:predicted nucleic acid-binding protein
VTDFAIDASVAIKWVVDEPETEQALALLSHDLLAPDLLVAECANILWKKVRRTELTEAEASLAARLLTRADVELVPIRPQLEPATWLAILLNHPAYDCVYLALAEARGCLFVTADTSFARKAQAAGLGAKVIVLGSIASPIDPPA